MAKHCVVCNLPEGQTCEMCSGSESLMSYMYQELLPEPEPEARCVEAKVNIGSGEDVCLA